MPYATHHSWHIGFSLISIFCGVLVLRLAQGRGVDAWTPLQGHRFTPAQQLPGQGKVTRSIRFFSRGSGLLFKAENCASSQIPRPFLGDQLPTGSLFFGTGWYVGLLDGITDAGLTELGEVLPNLHSLDISHCKKITDQGIRSLAEGCPNLSTLRLDGCKSVTDGSLQALSRNCTKLEELGLQSCIHITDNGLSTLAQGCRSIQILEMNKCVNVGDTGVMKIAETCPHLKILNLSDCLKIENKAVMSLAEGCKRLEVLMIGGCRLVSDEAIRTLASVCGRSLRILQLEWCLNISNDSLQLVLSLCPQLENLNIACCDKVTDHAFSCLGNGGCGSHLKDLRISNCPGISVAGIALVARFCCSLQRLDVRSCAQITEETVNRAGIHFADHCKLIY